MISAKRVGRLTLTILAVASLGACARSVPSPETPRPETPLVVYREFQENGSTRTIRANHEKQGTFDINSVVEVRVNEEELSAAVRTGALPPAPDVTDLLTLIGRLAAAMTSLDDARSAQEAARNAWAAAEQDPGSRDAFVAAAGRNARLSLAIEAPINDAVELRMKDSDSDTRNEEMDRVAISLVSGPTHFGLNWSAVRVAIETETRYLQSVLDTLSLPPELELQISGQRLGSSDAVHLALPGYNDVEAGPIDRFTKIQLEPSQQELAVYRDTEALASKIGTQNSVSEALRAFLNTQFQGQGAAIEEIIAAAREVLRVAETDLQQLAGIFTTAAMQTLLSQIETGVRASRAGQELERIVIGLQTELEQLAKEIGLLNSYAALPDGVGSLPADVAMQQILSAVWLTNPLDDATTSAALFSAAAWRRRANLLEDLPPAIAALPASARPALQNAIPNQLLTRLISPAFSAAIDRLGNVSVGAVDWVSRVLLGASTLAMRDLTVPEGQRPLSLAGDADTKFDIRRIAAGRQPNDEIVLTYELLANGQSVSGGWEDHFRIRSYGWSARTIASLGFVNRRTFDTYSPRAMLTWVARYKPWPKSGELGTSPGFWKTLVGIPSLGLTTTNLDFDDDQEIELGVAGTMGLVQDWVLLGYGINLQSSEKRQFWFFSIRFLTGSGGIGK